MSELGYWTKNTWDGKPVFIIRINNIHSSTINYTELVIDPFNNYKIETFLNGECQIETWENSKNTFNKHKRANIVEIFRFKVSELDLNNYDTIK